MDRTPIDLLRATNDAFDRLFPVCPEQQKEQQRIASKLAQFKREEELDFFAEVLTRGEHISLELNQSGLYGDKKDGITVWVDANGSRYEAEKVDIHQAVRIAIDRDYQAINDILKDRDYRMNGLDAYTEAEARRA